MYSGTIPEFIDGDVFKTKISLNGTVNGTVNDTVNGTVNDGVKLTPTEQAVLDCIRDRFSIILNHRLFRLSFVYHVPLVTGSLFLDLCIFAFVNQSVIPHDFKHSESDNGIKYVGIQLRRIEFRSRFGKFLLFAFFFFLILFCF